MNVRFYTTSSGKSPVEELLHTCSSDVKHDFIDAINLLSLGRTLEMPLSKNLSNIYPGLHELRLKDASGCFRFFYFIKKQVAIYFIHAFKKKEQKLRKKVQKLVLHRLKEI